MEKEKKSRAYKVLLIIPVALFIISIVSFILAICLEFPTSRGVIYGLCFILALICFALSVFPGIILSIAGTIIAAMKKDTTTMVLGLFESFAGVGGIYLIWYAVFVLGPSV